MSHNAAGEKFNLVLHLPFFVPVPSNTAACQASQAAGSLMEKAIFDAVCLVTRHSKSSPDGAPGTHLFPFPPRASEATVVDSSILPHYPQYNAVCIGRLKLSAFKLTGQGLPLSSYCQPLLLTLGP